MDKHRRRWIVVGLARHRMVKTFDNLNKDLRVHGELMYRNFGKIEEIKEQC